MMKQYYLKEWIRLNRNKPFNECIVFVLMCIILPLLQLSYRFGVSLRMRRGIIEKHHLLCRASFVAPLYLYPVAHHSCTSNHHELPLIINSLHVGDNNKSQNIYHNFCSVWVYSIASERSISYVSSQCTLEVEVWFYDQ